MAIGDTDDWIGRIRAVLPQGWFGDNAPVLATLLTGFASGFAWAYSLIALGLDAVLMTTAPNIWLDLHAEDFLGNTLLRRTQESDASWLARVQASIFPPGCSRPAMINRLTLLTGRAPVIFEPTQPQDTGAYGYGGLGYGVAGGYGSLALPYQSFVTAYRPQNQGVPLLAGYSGDQSSPVYAPLGYGQGLGSYVSEENSLSGVTDADIYQTIAEVEPAGSIAWSRISN